MGFGVNTHCNINTYQTRTIKTLHTLEYFKKVVNPDSTSNRDYPESRPVNLPLLSNLSTKLLSIRQHLYNGHNYG